MEHPELLASLALCDTTSRVPREAREVWEERARAAEERGMEPLVDSTLERWFTPAFRERRPEVVGRVGAMIRSTYPKGYAACCRAIAELNLTERLSSIGAPTLVLVGDEDPSTPPDSSQEIHERLPGSELVVLPSARHLSNVEQADAFNATLARFLARVA
jgi:pimeloyl-ACP methyl ester carboxylesterase